MASIRSQILDYIVDQLDAIPGVNAVRSRLVPVRREEGTRVIVSWAGETAVQGFHDSVERTLTVKVNIIARGDIPDQVADAVAVKCYAKLNSSATISKMGGLAFIPIVEDSRTPSMEDTDDGAVDYEVLFTVVYHTTVASEESQP